MSDHFPIARIMIAAAALASVTACGPSGEKAGEESANQAVAAPEAAVPAAPAVTASTAPAAFAACTVCHSIEPGKIGVGPPLFGVVGRAAGSVPGYTYSPAMKASGVTWSAETIDSFITSPHSLVAGTKMAYPGLKDAAKRAEIIRYLETLK